MVVGAAEGVDAGARGERIGAVEARAGLELV